MKVLLLQLDGSIPNLALMRLSAHHKSDGDTVGLRQCRNRRSAERGLFDSWDRVYASCVFEKTRPIAQRIAECFPGCTIGGSGWDETTTLEAIGVTTLEQDYSLYPAFRSSIGYTQRGCRFSCSFCKVPRMEGKVREYQSVFQLWRGEPWPRELLLLDNDFFGSPHWRAKIQAIRDGGFKVCFNQGINARCLSDRAAEAIASVDYRDDSFRRKRIYTAWDSIGDEGPLFRGLRALVRHGVKPDEILVYMLIGYNDTPEDREYRRRQLRDFGCRPYPMPFVRTAETMGFQRWVVRRADLKCSWDEYKAANYRPEKVG